MRRERTRPVFAFSTMAVEENTGVFSRGLIGTLILLSLCLLVAFPASANPRYSGLVIEINKGAVLYEENADAKRYPASLTKVMTIYMAFEALESGKLTWNQRLPVTRHAASQSPTNIGLREGERVSVQDLVESLIVHSANDSAVVLAEGMGGTESNFGTMMTKKARELGMFNTTFRNASGLPDPRQSTTARDMARLGIAIRRDFPDRYHLFKKSSFKYRGRTYNSHNRVVRNYRGADGLKTGYIRASGFNLITSATRDGNYLVAVVMGGRTARTRDQQMISLLDDAFAKLRSGKTPEQRYALNAPVPMEKPVAEEEDSVIAGMPEAYAGLPEVPRQVAAVAPPALKPIEDGAPQVLSTAIDEGKAPAPARKPMRFEPVAQGNQASPGQAGTLSLASVQRPQSASITPERGALPHDMNHIWGIQVGTFSDSRDAMLAAANAVNIVGDELQGSVIQVTDYDRQHSTLHRARIAGLREDQARNACRQLSALKEACFVFKMRMGNL